MSPDQYVHSVLTKYQVVTGQGSSAYQAGQALYPLIAEWANSYLLQVLYSGSYAKGTAVRGRTDVDLFISLSPNTPGTLGQVYQNLFNWLREKGYAPIAQNVSIGINYGGVAVDLVPGRKQTSSTTDHSLYHRKSNSWKQTNVDQHIARVRSSGRLGEIRAIKIWRQLHKLDFPSFYLELTVIDALSGRSTTNTAENVLTALRYISNNLVTARVVDPASSSNVLSDDLTVAEKRLIANTAKTSAAQQYWANIIW